MFITASYLVRAHTVSSNHFGKRFLLKLGKNFEAYQDDSALAAQITAALQGLPARAPPLAPLKAPVGIPDTPQGLYVF